MSERRITPKKTKVNLSVSIPVETGGYTGQRDAWESTTKEWKVVEEDDGRVLLEHPNVQMRIWFDMDDLKAAWDIVGPAKGPVYREQPEFVRSVGEFKE